MGVFKTVRIVLHVLTLLATVAAVILVITAIMTPYWRSCTNDQLGETRELGLWKVCLNTRAIGRTTCEWRETEPDVPSNFHSDNKEEDDRIAINRKQQKYVTSWERNTLILLSISTVCGVLALVCGGVGLFVDFCQYKPILKCMCIAWIILHFLACLLAISGFMIYLLYSYARENRTIVDQATRLELTYGASFYNCIIGIALYGVSLVFCLICTILVCVLAHREKYDYAEVPRQSHGGHVIVSNV